MYSEADFTTYEDVLLTRKQSAQNGSLVPFCDKIHKLINPSTELMFFSFLDVELVLR